MRTTLWLTPALLALVLAAGAHAAPLVGPARGVGEQVSSSAFGSQRDENIATDGNQYLVVWADARENGMNSDVYAGRVSAAGAPLDTTPLRIGLGVHDQEGPSVAFGGGVFLVVWDDLNDGYIFGQRIDQQGHLLDLQPFLVFESLRGRWPRIAFDGTDFVVVANVQIDSWDIVGARVAPDRSRTFSEFVVAGGQGVQQWSDIACQTSGLCLVAFENTPFGGASDVGAVRLQSGAVLDTTARPVSGGNARQGWVSVTVRGSNSFFVAWEDERTGNVDLRGTGVLLSGAVTDVPGILLSPNSHQPALSWNGALTVLTYRDRADGRIKARTIEPAVSAPVRLCSEDSAGQELAGISWGASAGLAIWVDSRAGGDLYINVVPTTPVALGAGTLLTTGLNAQSEVAQASNGQVSLVVWSDVRQGSSDLYFARVSRDGQVLDAGGVALVADPNNQRAPAVAWLGNSWLVVWVDENRPSATVMYRRVAADGSIIGANAQTLAPSTGDQNRPQVTSNDGQALVTFEDNRNGTFDLFGLRFSSTGQPLDSLPFAIATTSAQESRARIAAAGTGYVVTWAARIGNDVFPRVASVPATGAPGATADLVWWGVAEDELAVSCGPRSCLTLWTNGDLWLREVSLTGAPLGVPLTLAVGAEDQLRPALQWRGDHYAVVWLDLRSKQTWDLVSARLQENGLMLDPRPVPLAPDALGDISTVTLDSLDADTMMLAYVAFDPVLLEPRVQARTWRETAAASDGGTSGGGDGTFVSLPPSVLMCGATYEYTPSVSGAGPVVWRAAARDSETLPADLEVDASTGRLKWTPSLSESGDHYLSLVARGAGWETSQALELTVLCQQRTGGVGCSSTGAIAALLSLLALRRRHVN